MTLVSSGTIRMSDINTELGRSSTATISLDAAENGSYGAINTNSTSRPSGTNPASMSEWYSYNHNAAPAVTYTYDSYAYYYDPCSGGFVLYYGSDGNWYRYDGSTYDNVTGISINYYIYEEYGFYVYEEYALVQGPSKNYYGQNYSSCAPY